MQLMASGTSSDMKDLMHMMLQNKMPPPPPWRQMSIIATCSNKCRQPICIPVTYLPLTQVYYPHLRKLHCVCSVFGYLPKRWRVMSVHKVCYFLTPVPAWACSHFGLSNIQGFTRKSGYRTRENRKTCPMVVKYCVWFTCQSCVLTSVS